MQKNMMTIFFRKIALLIMKYERQLPELNDTQKLRINNIFFSYCILSQEQDWLLGFLNNQAYHLRLRRCTIAKLLAVLL